jgi:hypothetical protein
VALVVGALLAVVVGHAMLANGQVRLAGIEPRLTLEQSAHHQLELQVAAAETPARVVAAALGAGMVHVPQIELPYVPLTTPLATPKVTAAPPPATTTPTTAPTP